MGAFFELRFSQEELDLIAECLSTVRSQYSGRPDKVEESDRILDLEQYFAGAQAFPIGGSR